MSIYFASIFILWGAYASQNLEQNDNDTRKQMYLSQQTNIQNDDIEEFTLDEGIKVNASQLNFEDEKDDLEQIDLRFFMEDKCLENVHEKKVAIFYADKKLTYTTAKNNLNSLGAIPNKNNFASKIRNQIGHETIVSIPHIIFSPGLRFVIMKIMQFRHCVRENCALITLGFSLFALIVVTIIVAFRELTFPSGEANASTFE
jgi:hypothetical protein